MKTIVLCFLGLSAGLSLGGCRRSGTTPSSPPAESAQTQDPREQMFKAMDSVTSYRRSQLEEYEGTKGQNAVKVETEVQAVCPGRSHFRTTRNGRVDDEFFVEGAQVYLSKGQWKVNRGNWKRAPGCPLESEFNGWVGMDNALSARQYLSLYFLTVYYQRVKLIKGDIETFDDVPCQTWQAAFTGNFEVPYQVQYWIGVADNLPRRLLVTAPDRRVEIRYWDWNSPVIDVPDPIV